MPVRVSTIGSASSAFASTVTCRPRGASCMASALGRSAGVSAVPKAASVRGSTVSTCAPAGTDSEPSMTPSGSNGSKNWRIRGIGENRQSSCDRFGSGKSAGLREVKRSAGLPVGLSRAVT